jgi:hypothetical protein
MASKLSRSGSDEVHQPAGRGRQLSLRAKVELKPAVEPPVPERNEVSRAGAVSAAALDGDGWRRSGIFSTSECGGTEDALTTVVRYRLSLPASASRVPGQEPELLAGCEEWPTEAVNCK